MCFVVYKTFSILSALSKRCRVVEEHEVVVGEVAVDGVAAVVTAAAAEEKGDL